MDVFEKRVIYAALSIIVFMIFSVMVSQKISESSVPGCIPYDESYLEGRITQLDDKSYQVFVNASMWAFDPEEIRLPLGAEVDFYLTSKDVVHGFHIPEKNLNLMAVPGAVNKMTVTFDKPGVFDMLCHEFCGSGHQYMRGLVIVE